MKKKEIIKEKESLANLAFPPPPVQSAAHSSTLAVPPALVSSGVQPSTLSPDLSGATGTEDRLQPREELQGQREERRRKYCNC